MKTTQVIIYVRVSKSRNDQTSLATQEQECRRYASQNGWEVVAVFIENGRSAYKKNVKRPEFDRAMRMIETKQASVFLVWKLDRFYRSGTEFNSAWQRIDSAGGLFASVMEPWIDTTSAMGRWQLSGIAYQAEIESENRAQRSTSWNNGRVSDTNGAGTPGGQRPYGFIRSGKGELTRHPIEATVIEKAAAAILKGESLKSIRRNLSPVSTRTDSDGKSLGIPMTARGLRHVLTSPTTFGLRRTPTGSLVKGCWQGILPEGKYAILQAVFTNPERRTASSNVVGHLLSGIVACGKCERNLGIRKWKANPTVRQPYIQESHRLTCECGNSIDERNANEVVMERLWETVTSDVWQTWKVKGHGFDTDVLDSIRARREQLDMMFLQGKFDSDPSRYESLNATLAEQESMALTNEPLDLPDVDDIRGSWESLPIIEKRKVINQAFSSIRCNPANGTRDPRKRMVVK